MARKSARNAIKDYKMHRKDIDERIRQNFLLKQKRHKRRRERDIKENQKIL